MSMTRKTITISSSMEDWVKAQIENGRYGNDSEYFRDLIRRDQDRRQAEHDLRALIDEGIHSGVSNASVSDIKERVEQRLRARGDLPANS